MVALPVRSIHRLAVEARQRASGDADRDPVSSAAVVAQLDDLDGAAAGERFAHDDVVTACAGNGEAAVTRAGQEAGIVGRKAPGHGPLLAATCCAMVRR